MTKAEELAAKAARLAEKKQGAAAPAAPARVERTERAPAVQSKPVRMTVDLPPAQDRNFKRWAAEAADTLGRSRVTKQEVVTALIARLLTDPALAEQIITDLGAYQ